MITKLDFYMNENFVNGVYGSCRDVAMASTNAKALGVMCGQWGATYCTGRRWFDYMGDPDQNMMAPFKINYIYKPKQTNKTHDNFKLFNTTIVPCNETASVRSMLDLMSKGVPFFTLSGGLLSY